MIDRLKLIINKVLFIVVLIALILSFGAMYFSCCVSKLSAEELQTKQLTKKQVRIIRKVEALQKKRHWLSAEIDVITEEIEKLLNDSFEKGYTYNFDETISESELQQQEDSHGVDQCRG